MIEFNLPGMTCGHCERAVTEAVRRVDPGAAVQIELTTHRVSIESKQPREAFERELIDEGYAPA